MRAAAILVALPALAACATHPGRNVPAAENYDGVYAGTVTEDPACGTEARSISFQVAGRAVTAHGGHRRSRLSGSISQNGQVYLQNTLDGNPVIGAIDNGTLIATETAANPAHKKHIRSRLEDPMALPCIWHYEASRAPG